MEFKEMREVNVREVEDKQKEWKEKIKAHLDNQAFLMGYEKRPPKPTKSRKRRRKKR